jgi:hypothetical protein
MDATPESQPTILTISEANAALPEVSRLLERLQQLREEIMEGQEQRRELTKQLDRGSAPAHTGLKGQYAARIAQQDQLFAAAETALNELEAAGAVLKDLESGLVDFYGERDGQTVLLCWRLGEALRIAHWHTLEGGFAGRQPVDSRIK